nr:protein-lysine n-methyltransferase efm5 [Quercus suber]
MDSDDDMPTLPADTLAALQAFRSEQSAREKQFLDLKTHAENKFQNAKLSMDLFGEDWNQSQFWYTDDTARTLAKQLLHGADGSSAIAIVSAPSVYIALRNLLSEDESEEARGRPVLRLFEFDRRFEVFGEDFVEYDFQNPLRLPVDLKGRFDRIICDPPFLSEDCQTKTAITARYLARSWDDKLRCISCTGERMETVIHKVYAQAGVKTSTFEPEHSKGLSNEFRCYTNFECEDWKWQ